MVFLQKLTIDIHVNIQFPAPFLSMIDMTSFGPDYKGHIASSFTTINLTREYRSFKRFVYHDFAPLRWVLAHAS